MLDESKSIRTATLARGGPRLTLLVAACDV